MMMSANIPGPSGLSRGTTQLKTALPAGPISSYNLAMASFQKPIDQSTTNTPSKNESSGSNKLLHSTLWQSPQTFSGYAPSSRNMSSGTSVSTLAGEEPEISYDTSSWLPKTDSKAQQQSKAPIVPTYPPQAQFQTHGTAEKTPSSVMLAFLGQAMTTSQTALSSQVSPSHGFYKFKPTAANPPPLKISPNQLQHPLVITKPRANPLSLSQMATSLHEKSKEFDSRIQSISQYIKRPELDQHLATSSSNIPSNSESLTIYISKESATLPYPSSPVTPAIKATPITFSAEVPSVLRKVFPVRQQQPGLLSRELLNEFDPCKSEEIETSPTPVEKMPYQPQLDVGSYIMEPIKSLYIEQYPCLRPLFPKWETVSKRIDKFSPTFPVYESCSTITDIAEAGFFSIGMLNLFLNFKVLVELMHQIPTNSYVINNKDFK